MRRKYIPAIVAILGAAAVGVGLEMLGTHREPKKTQTQTTAAPPAAADPGSKDHELKALEVELEQKPGHPPILLRMAQLSRELGKMDDCVKYLRRLTAADDGNLDGHLELGRALYETNDVAGAIAETNRVLKIDPKNVDALYNLGAIYANVNKPELARQYWTQAVASDPQSDSGRNAQAGLRKLPSGSPVHTADLPRR